MSRKTNGAADKISSQYSLSLYTHCTSHCLNLAVVASFEEVIVRNKVSVVKQLFIFFFLHTPSLRRSWKKLYRTSSQNLTCWSSKISAEQDGLNVSTLSIDQETLLLHCCLFWEHFNWRFSHVVSWLGDRCQYSLAGNNKNRIPQCSCDYQWVSTISQGAHNEPSRGG